MAVELVNVENMDLKAVEGYNEQNRHLPLAIQWNDTVFVSALTGPAVAFEERKKVLDNIKAIAAKSQCPGPVIVTFYTFKSETAEDERKFITDDMQGEFIEGSAIHPSFFIKDKDMDVYAVDGQARKIYEKIKEKISETAGGAESAMQQ